MTVTVKKRNNNQRTLKRTTAAAATTRKTPHLSLLLFTPPSISINIPPSKIVVLKFTTAKGEMPCA